MPVSVAAVLELPVAVPLILQEKVASCCCLCLSNDPALWHKRDRIRSDSLPPSTQVQPWPSPCYLRCCGSGSVGEVLTIFAVGVGIEPNNGVQRSCPSEESACADQLDDFFLAEMAAQQRKHGVVNAVRIDHQSIYRRNGGSFARSKIAAGHFVLERCDGLRLRHSTDVSYTERGFFILHFFRNRLQSYRGAVGACIQMRAADTHQFQQAGLDQAAFASEKVREHGSGYRRNRF